MACALIASAALTLALAPAAFADTVEVNTTEDEDDVVPNLNCSLREAIFTVNGGSDVGGCALQTATGADTITFDPDILTPAGTETIDLEEFGQLEIDTDDNNAVEIQGPGSNELTVTNTNPNNRIFLLSDANNQAHTISGLEISGGDLVDPGVQQGAGIIASSALTLGGVELRDNTAAPTGTASGDASAQGAGIWSSNDLTIRNSVIEDNTATAVNSDNDVDSVFANGGGIWHEGGALTIENSSVSGNDVVADDTSDGAGFNEAVGGGIFASSTVTVTQTTLSGNTATAGSSAAAATAKGAGIRLGGLDSRIELSTIVGNSAVASGPGPTIRGAGVMVIDAPNMSLVSSTIASNGDATDVDTEGANLFAEGAGGVAVANTIVASPVGATAATSNCFEDTTGNIDSNGFNVDFEPGASSSSCNLDTDPPTTDLTIDPDLLPLADNGGIGETMLPDVGSPVIDKGSAAAQDEDLDTEDQRALGRPAFFDTISDAPLGDGADIGAVEVQIAPPTFTATTPASPNADDTPNVLGSVGTTDGAGTPVVSLFTNASCTVPSGTPADPSVFASPGIVASPPVPHNNVITTFHGTIETDYGVSHCSTGAFPNTIGYQNTLIDPTPPVVSPPPETTTPAPKKKCKKGFVRKKGKCVKKKKRKKKG